MKYVVDVPNKKIIVNKGASVKEVEWVMKTIPSSFKGYKVEIKPIYTVSKNMKDKVILTRDSPIDKIEATKVGSISTYPLAEGESLNLARSGFPPQEALIIDSPSIKDSNCNKDLNIKYNVDTTVM